MAAQRQEQRKAASPLRAISLVLEAVALGGFLYINVVWARPWIAAYISV